MTIADWLTITAIVFSPIVAIRIQKWWEKLQEAKQRKFFIFRVLMATRAERLSREHVQALNMIDIDFYKNEEIIDAWRLYHDHLNSLQEPFTPDDLKRWIEKSEELLIDLLFIMSRKLNYTFDKVNLKKGIYSPKAHGDLEQEQNIIRKGLIGLISNEKAINVKLIKE